MKNKWKWVDGNSMQSCSQTCGGSDDSARAPRMNIRTCGFPTAASSVSGAPAGTCRVLRNARPTIEYGYVLLVTGLAFLPASERLPSGVKRWLFKVKPLC